MTHQAMNEAVRASLQLSPVKSDRAFEAAAHASTLDSSACAFLDWLINRGGFADLSDAPRPLRHLDVVMHLVAEGFVTYRRSEFDGLETVRLVP